MPMHYDCVISLCDGIALARDSLRLADIGYDRYIGVEIEAQARTIADYRAARDGMPPIERPVNDIRKLSAAHLPKAASIIIIAGIPCTERSLANKNFTGSDRVAEGTDSGLIREFVRIRQIAMTAAGDDGRVDWIVENVPSAASANNYYNSVIGGEPVMINAAWFGAQHRQRLFWASWQITPPPPSQWSDETFADIADDSPKCKRYTYIIWQGVSKKAGKPHRVGVLPTPSVLRQILKGQEPASPKIYGEGKMAAVAAGGSKGSGGLMVESNVSGGSFAIRQIERVYDGNGKTTTIQQYTSGGNLTCKIAGGGQSHLRVVAGDGKTPSHTQRCGGRIVISRTESGQRQSRVYDNGGKVSAIMTHKSGGNHSVKVSDNSTVPSGSVQDRVHSQNAKMKAIPANAGGRTEGIIAESDDGEIRRFVIDGEELFLPVVNDGARCLTTGEIERLFGLPTDNTAAPGMSKTARIRAIGGGWDIRQMAHCLRQIGKQPIKLI